MVYTPYYISKEATKARVHLLSFFFFKYIRSTLPPLSSMANPYNTLFSSLISDIKSYSGKDPLLPWLRYPLPISLSPYYSINFYKLIKCFFFYIMTGVYGRWRTQYPHTFSKINCLDFFKNVRRPFYLISVTPMTCVTFAFGYSW